MEPTARQGNVARAWALATRPCPGTQAACSPLAVGRRPAAGMDRSVLRRPLVVHERARCPHPHSPDGTPWPGGDMQSGSLVAWHPRPRREPHSSPLARLRLSVGTHHPTDMQGQRALCRCTLLNTDHNRFLALCQERFSPYGRSPVRGAHTQGRGAGKPKERDDARYSVAPLFWL
jgi:hypothetical protein